MIDFDKKKYKYLFLDRDGVINIERPNDYAKNVDEFVFIENAAKAISILSQHFDEIFIATNQRGIGKGLMTRKSLDDIHNHMLAVISDQGGQISNIYFCSDLSSNSINRKPNIGMAMKAQEEYPQISFDKSVMIGNSRSDIDFGKKLDMYTILVGDKYPVDDKIYQIVDAYYQNLYTFALTLQN